MVQHSPQHGRTSDAGAPRATLGSVVIPAHDEGAVIRRCLDALLDGFAPAELEVVVVCNGCRDDTPTQARSSGHAVRVLELDAASKPAALRAGEKATHAFPRLYLDADVVLPGAAARGVLERLRAGAIAARPPIRYDSTGASMPVRSYFRARSRVPAVMGSLWGAGVYGLSAAGRGRFGAFPDVVGDDLWVDRQFTRDEIEIVDCAPVIVAVPRRARDLVRVLRRALRGKAKPAGSAAAGHGGAPTTTSTLRDLGRLAVGGPRDVVDATTYAAFAMGARLALAIGPAAAGPTATGGWERDDSSRAG